MNGWYLWGWTSSIPCEYSIRSVQREQSLFLLLRSNRFWCKILYCRFHLYPNLKLIIRHTRYFDPEFSNERVCVTPFGNHQSEKDLSLMIFACSFQVMLNLSMPWVCLTMHLNGMIFTSSNHRRSRFVVCLVSLTLETMVSVILHLDQFFQWTHWMPLHKPISIPMIQMIIIDNQCFFDWCQFVCSLANNERCDR